MTKRIVSLVLCLILVLGIVTPVVNAADDSTVSWDNVTFSDVTIDGDTVNSTTSVTSPTQLGSTASTETVATTAPDCDCGNEGKDVIIHADSCMLKKYYQGICKQSSLAIWGMWSDLPTDAREYILAYLSWTDNAKLQELEDRLSTGAFAEDSVTVDGTDITATNIPEYGSLTVTAADSAVAEQYASEQGWSSEDKLFAWDISVVTASGQEWQPDGTTVKLELSVPGVTLHKYATVYVIHVDDAGNATQIPAQVTADGKIAFETTGFSTFVGFTVDFDYEGVKFSIPGESTIYLSELFEQLRIPHDVDEVTNVVFSDTSLVTVAKDGTDWLLTSLKAFTSNETLNVTLKDGTSFTIKVTDAQYAGLFLNADPDADDGYVEGLRVDGGDGYATFKLGTDGSISTDEGMDADYAIDDYPLVVVGPGTMTIGLQNIGIYNKTNKDYSYNALLWKLHQIRIVKGATLVIRLGGSFQGDETITLQGQDDCSMFDIWDGNLVIRCSDTSTLPTGLTDADNSLFASQGADWADTSSFVPLILNGKSITSGIQPIIDIRNSSGTAQNVFIEDVTFQNAKYRAIYCRANELANFSVKDCVFESSVKVHYSASEQGGAAIRINAWMNGNKASDTSRGDQVDITNFKVDNCKFDGVIANNDGGAIESYGRIASTSISNSKFLNCKAQQWDAATGNTTEYGAHGGAIYFAGYMGKVLFDTVTFDGCQAKEYGGAVCFRHHLNQNNNASRYNEIIFQNCSFNNCVSRTKHGGAVSLKAQVNQLKFLGCTFTNCTAENNGGALSIGSEDISSINNWQTYFKVGSTDTEDTQYGARNADSFWWTDTKRITTIKSLEIGSYKISDSETKNTSFTNCVAKGVLNGNTSGDIYDAGNGGAIEFVEAAYIKTASIADATFDACIATDGGSAIFLANTVVKSLTLDTLDIKNCDFKKDDNGNYVSGDAGGTVRTVGKTTCALAMKNCTFSGNKSHENGGGFYWNASMPRDGVTVKAELSNCTFNGNYAENYGGGIYCEADMTITGCNIKYNTALWGGGIAQQVYNNNYRMITESGLSTTLKLDPTTYVWENTATFGGGISVRANATQAIDPSSWEDPNFTHTVDFQLNGASVYKNHAVTNGNQLGLGGGIFFIAETYEAGSDNQKEVDRYTKKIVIDGNAANKTGNVYKNDATGDGGGIYMSSSENTSLEIKEGHISGNSAGGNGGGVYLTGKNAKCIVTGGLVGGEGNDSAGVPLSNTAVCGGGIAISGGAKIEMTGGEISYNKATSTIDTNRRGGGIWLDNGTTELYNSITLTGGSIIYNTADNEGGGVHVGIYANFQLDNGSISYNSADSGGGVSLYEAWLSAVHAHAVINGGSVSYNTATSIGGAFFGHYYANITINDGTISHNTVTNGSGGGIANRFFGELNITGGLIEENYATNNNGGGIYLENAPANITGGEITKNHAKNGGGLYVYKNKVTIGADGESHGTVSHNEAVNGGGVYAVSGADVTITNGYLTYNKAIGTPTGVTTAYHLNDELKGTGGGVYIANGVSDDLSSFTLTGDTYAIYGNLADFAADDVFANGVYTKLNVPTVEEMDLSEYDYRPESWFEDYPTDDTEYSNGLNLAPSESGIGDGEGEHVYRLRFADPLQRVMITDADGVAKVNADSSPYVCMTLGMPTAVNDTVVIDYGKPVDIHVLTNEIMYVATPTLIGIGPKFDYPDGECGYAAEPSGYSDKYDGVDFGSATANRTTGVVTFSIDTMSMNKEAVFSYVVKYNNSNKSFYYYADVTVIPATTIYYEDDFGTISYGVYNASDNTENSSSKWVDVGTSGSMVQDEDRPGAALKHTIDADNVYGYDSHYKNCTTYSLGSAKKVTVDANKYATATFDFWGTGFDVISLTSADSGTIGVIVSQYGENDSLTVVENYLVDTYYGYTREFHRITYTYVEGKWIIASEGDDVKIKETEMGTSDAVVENPSEGDNRVAYETKWVVDTASNDTLYQVPVIKVNCKNGYGHYQVKIVATYADFFNHKDDGSYDFYLDAIRIYDPANDGAGNTTIQDAYIADGEGWPSYQELRNKIIDAKTFDSLGKDDVVDGIVFIDGNGTNSSISDYQNFGPNNELYLAKGQAVAFTLDNPTALAGVQIALKSVGSNSVPVKISYYDTETEKIVTFKEIVDDATTTDKDESIATASDLYYDISALAGKTVIIQNTSTTEGSILSITNIKTTYTEQPTTFRLLRTIPSEIEDMVAALNAVEEEEQPEQPGENVPGTDAEENPVTGDLNIEIVSMVVLTACVMMLAVLALPKARKRNAK